MVLKFKITNKALIKKQLILCLSKFTNATKRLRKYSHCLLKWTQVKRLRNRWKSLREYACSDCGSRGSMMCILICRSIYGSLDKNMNVKRLLRLTMPGGWWKKWSSLWIFMITHKVILNFKKIVKNMAPIKIYRKAYNITKFYRSKYRSLTMI